ncbi:MAG: hypothetical protein WBB73_10710 [Candidatus Aminicenantaceae bacterium]
MNNQRPGMFVPAFIGGALAGILTGIPLVNCFCCLWIVGGGAVAAYFLRKDSPVELRSGDGAIVGIFSGMVAAIIAFLISIPLAPLDNAIARSMMDWASEYADQMPEFWESIMRGEGLESSVPFMMLELFINIVVFSALGALGGIIGISLFKKKSAQLAQGVIDVPKDQVDTETSDNH